MIAANDNLFHALLSEDLSSVAYLFSVYSFCIGVIRYLQIRRGVSGYWKGGVAAVILACGSCIAWDLQATAENHARAMVSFLIMGVSSMIASALFVFDVFTCFRANRKDGDAGKMCEKGLRSNRVSQGISRL